MKKQRIWFWFFCLIVIGVGNLAQTADKKEVPPGKTADQYRPRVYKRDNIGGVQIFEALGQGAYGNVYLGRLRGVEDRPGELVAIKISCGAACYSNAAKREAEILAFLHTQPKAESFFVGLLDHFVHEKLGSKYFCLVLEYAPEKDLYSYIEQAYSDRKVPLEVIKKIMQQLLHALDFLEKHGVVHADLKPENVMIDH